MARSRGQSNPAGALAAILGSFRGGGGLKLSVKPDETDKKLREIFATALAQEQAKSAFDPERQMQRELMDLGRQLQPVSRPEGGFSRSEMEQLGPQGLQQQQALFEAATEQRNQPVTNRIETLLRVMGKRPEKSLAEKALEAQLLTETRERAKGEFKFSERAKTDFARISAFENSLNELQQAASLVPRGPIQGRVTSGIAAVTGGGGAGLINKTVAENVDLYNSLRPGIAAGLYRAITGDDRISDIDAERRALPFVPPLSRTPGAAQKRLDVLKRAIQKRKEGIFEAQRLGIDPPTLSGADFLSVIKQSEREIPESNLSTVLMTDGTTTYQIPREQVEEARRDGLRELR